MRPEDAAWVAFWVAFGALDYWADRHGKSLSTTTRRLFRTDTIAGGVVFSTALAAGARALDRHIRK